MRQVTLRPISKTFPCPDITGEGHTRGEALADAVDKAAAQNLSLAGVDLSGLDRRCLKCNDPRILIGANLHGSQWTDDLVLTDNPIIIGLPDYYTCFILHTNKGKYLQVGCEVHPVKVWQDIEGRQPISSKYEQIDRDRARAFWAKYRDWLLMACEL